MVLPSKKILADYYEIIKNPLDFKKIKVSTKNPLDFKKIKVSPKNPLDFKKIKVSTKNPAYR